MLMFGILTVDNAGVNDDDGGDDDIGDDGVRDVVCW